MQSMAYLKAHGINVKSSNGLIERANNIRALTEAENVAKQEPTEENLESLRMLEEEKLENPELFEPWPYPAIWDTGMDLQQCHQASMHLLFLGVVKTTVFGVQQWAARRKKYSQLREFIRINCAALEKLNLSWMKVVSYQGEKLGGWISENFLGFSRCIPWLYSMIDNLPDDEKYEPPNKPRANWTGADLRGWLRSQNLKTGGPVRELQKRVKDNWDMPEAEGVLGHLSTIKQLLLTKYHMVSYLMGMTGKEDNHSEVAARLIRRFLTFEYDHEVEIGNDKPTWLTSYNFLCLLNLPKEIEMLGPIRNRWEGGVQGEGFIRWVKPRVSGTSRLNWERNLLTTLIKQKATLVVSEVHASSQDDKDKKPKDKKQLDTTMVFVYQSKSDFLLAFANHNPISVVLEDDNVFVCYCEGGDVCFLRLTHGKDEPATHLRIFGLNYSTWDYAVHDGIAVSANCYGVMLPCVGKPTKTYTLVRDDWKVFKKENEYVFPHKYIDFTKKGWQD